MGGWLPRQMVHLCAYTHTHPFWPTSLLNQLTSCSAIAGGPFDALLALVTAALDGTWFPRVVRSIGNVLADDVACLEDAPRGEQRGKACIELVHAESPSCTNN